MLIKYKIHELSKDFNISSKDIIALLKEKLVMMYCVLLQILLNRLIRQWVIMLFILKMSS